MGRIVLWTIGIVASIALLIAIAFALELGGLQWKSYFNPKHAAVDREVFKQTRSYNEGKEQDLVKYRYEYMRAKTNDDKEAIASTVRLAFADYNESLLESDELRDFLRMVKFGK